MLTHITVQYALYLGPFLKEKVVMGQVGKTLDAPVMLTQIENHGFFLDQKTGLKGSIVINSPTCECGCAKDIYKKATKKEVEDLTYIAVEFSNPSDLPKITQKLNEYDYIHNPETESYAKKICDLHLAKIIADGKIGLKCGHCEEIHDWIPIPKQVYEKLGLE